MSEPKWRTEPARFRPPETPTEPMEFLSRSWSISALEVSKVLSPSQTFHYSNTNTTTNNINKNKLMLSGGGFGVVTEDIVAEFEVESTLTSGGVGVGVGNSRNKKNASVLGNPFSFASSETSQLVMDRIFSQSQEVSPRTSGRLSHSSGPLNGSLTDSPPLSPSELDDLKNIRSGIPFNSQYRMPSGTPCGHPPVATGGNKTVGRWLKDRREKRKEEARAQNAQLHAAISVAGVASAVAAIAAATAASSSSRKDRQASRTDMAVASAATLVAAQCVEAAEALGAQREHLASVVSSAVNVRSAGDITTLTAAAATALRGAATLKARAMKDVWNIAAVIPADKGIGGVSGNGRSGSSNSSFSGELDPKDNFLGICSRELLAQGCELLKRTRKGDLHWKIVSVYINGMNKVILKMKSRHVAGTITKKKKNVVLEVLKDMPAWPGRHLLEGGENRRYFGLRTVLRGVVEFECRSQKEYDVWTQGVSRLLTIVAERSNKHRI